MKKAYYLLFYKLYCFWKALSEDGLADWKAGLVVQTIQIFILLIIAIQIELMSKINVIPEGDPKIWAIPFCILLSIFNYYVFLHFKGWKFFEKEFNSYSHQKNLIINVIIFCTIFGILAVLIFTFYQMSLVDWSKPR